MKTKTLEEAGLIVLLVIIILGVLSLIFGVFEGEELAPAPVDSDDVLKQAIIEGNSSGCEGLDSAKREVCMKVISGELGG